MRYGLYKYFSRVTRTTLEKARQEQIFWRETPRKNGEQRSQCAHGGAKRPDFHTMERKFKCNVSVMIYFNQALSDCFVVGASASSPEVAKIHQFESH